MLPETKYSKVEHRNEFGVDISRHYVDQFGFYRQAITPSRSFRLGSFPNELNWSAIVFGLPYPAGDSILHTQVPSLTVIGNGLTIEVYAEGLGYEGVLLRSSLRQLFSTDNPDKMDFTRLLHASKPEVNAVFTTQINPFLHRGLPYAPYGRRVYNLEVGSGSNLLRVTAELNQDRSKETLEVMFVPDSRVGKPRLVTQIAREKSPEGWFLQQPARK